MLHVAELARQYEVNGGMSFRGFVEELREQADGGQAAEAPILEEGSDGVRLMTVHKAKGLEFPVVILADMTAKLRSDRADRLIDRAQQRVLPAARPLDADRAGDARRARRSPRDEAEGVRVAYVAATRARDLLVVPAVGDVAWEGGWTGPLNGAIYPPLGYAPHAGRGAGVPARSRRTPSGGVRTTIRRRQRPCAPGEHTFAGAATHGEAGYSVVWWDPHALGLGVEPAIGIRRESLIMKDVPERSSPTACASTSSWREGTRAGDRKGIDAVVVGAHRNRVGVARRDRSGQLPVPDRAPSRPSFSAGCSTKG